MSSRVRLPDLPPELQAMVLRQLCLGREEGTWKVLDREFDLPDVRFLPGTWREVALDVFFRETLFVVELREGETSVRTLGGAFALFRRWARMLSPANIASLRRLEFVTQEFSVTFRLGGTPPVAVDFGLRLHAAAIAADGEGWRLTYVPGDPTRLYLLRDAARRAEARILHRVQPLAGQLAGGQPLSRAGLLELADIVWEVQPALCMRTSFMFRDPYLDEDPSVRATIDEHVDACRWCRRLRW